MFALCLQMYMYVLVYWGREYIHTYMKYSIHTVNVHPTCIYNNTQPTVTYSYSAFIHETCTVLVHTRRIQLHIGHCWASVSKVQCYYCSSRCRLTCSLDYSEE